MPPTADEDIKRHRKVAGREISSIRKGLFHLGNKLSDLQDSLLKGDKSAQAYTVAQMRSTLAKYYLDLTDISKSLREGTPYRGVPDV